MKHLSSEILNALLDQRLADSERGDAQAHLAACAGCRAELAALEQVAAALTALAPEPVPVDLAPRVLAQIEPVQRARWIALLIIVEAAAAIALAVWQSETLALLFDRLPDIGATLVTFQQGVNDALNAINIEPVQAVAPTEWLMICAAAAAAWSIANRLLIRLPPPEEVV